MSAAAAAAAGGAGAPSSEATVVLVSLEGDKFTVPKATAQMSELVKSMTEEGA
jgi:hypothetical protein